jgi:hypothetical protein
LLSGGNYTGSGTFTVKQAAKSYNSTYNVTQVAARVEVSGIPDDLCFYWYVGGPTLGSGPIVGDSLTRRYSVWGSEATSGSPADRQVKQQKETAQGRAARAAVGC